MEAFFCSGCKVNAHGIRVVFAIGHTREIRKGELLRSIEEVGNILKGKEGFCRADAADHGAPAESRGTGR